MGYFELADNAPKPTAIRFFQEAAAALSAAREKIFDATIGTSVGALEPHVADMLMLMAFHYRDQEENGILNASQIQFLAAELSKILPELFGDDGILAKHGISMQPYGSSLGYPPSAGLPEVRKRAAQILREHFYPDLEFDNNQMYFCLGGTGGLTTVFRTLKGPFFAPEGYFSFYNDGMQAFDKSINAVPIESTGWTPTRESLQAGLSAYCEKNGIKPGELTGSIVLCNPGNPLTTMPTEEQYRGIADMAREVFPKLTFVIDDPYNNFTYNLWGFDQKKFDTVGYSNEEWLALCEKRKGLLDVAPDLFERSVIVKTLGKDVDATGGRFGICLCGDRELAAILPAGHFNLMNTVSSYMQQVIPIALDVMHRDEHRVRLAKTYLPRLAAICQPLKEEGILVAADNLAGGMFAVAALDNVLGLPIEGEFKNFLDKYFIKGDDKSPFKGETIENSFQIAAYSLYAHSTGIVPGEAFRLPKGMARLSVTQRDLEDSGEVGRRIVQASRNAMMEHILSAAKNPDYVVYSGDGFVTIPSEMFDESKRDRISRLHGVASVEDKDGDVVITFRSRELAMETPGHSPSEATALTHTRTASAAAKAAEHGL